MTNRHKQRTPNNAETFYNRGSADLALKKYQEALEDFNKAIKLKPDFARAFYNRGLVNLELEKYQEALEDFNEVIKLNLDYDTVFKNRSVLDLVEMPFEEALEVFDEAIKLNPDFALAFYNRGAANLALKKYQKAIEDFNEAIKLKPDDALVYTSRGRANFELGKYQEAIEDFTRAIALKTDDDLAFYARGKARFLLEEYPMAIKDFEEVLRLTNGQSPEAREALANLLAQLQKTALVNNAKTPNIVAGDMHIYSQEASLPPAFTASTLPMDDTQAASSKEWRCTISEADQLICVSSDQSPIRVVTKLPSTHQAWRQIPNDHYAKCETIEQSDVTLTHCVGEKTEFVEYDHNLNDEPSIASMLGSAAVRGAAYATLPAVIGDAFYLSGLMSQRNAERVKMLSNAVIILASGSYLATGASWLTNAMLQYAGCSPEKAMVAGNAAAFLVNTGRNITPPAIAATVVHYAAGRLGLWTEKQVIKQFASFSHVPSSRGP